MEECQQAEEDGSFVYVDTTNQDDEFFDATPAATTATETTTTATTPTKRKEEAIPPQHSPSPLRDNKPSETTEAPAAASTKSAKVGHWLIKI